METYLKPIEKPNSLGMKLVYFFTKRQFGKVITPLKVYSARMPIAFGMWGGKIAELDKKLILSEETTLLIREWVARLNICLFCMDAGRYSLMKKNMSEAKFDALEEYPTSPLFTEAERAALDYATELTRHKKVPPETFARLQNFYSEREICEIIYLIVSEHVYNLTNIGLNIHSDMLCDITKHRK
ncbi:carboxymuconolactone decarboxylase family protein [Adhaeribacter arboris]|uniref:Carboxymuconolactone decarboxylase family protein n=1 Tax=Adhaeribacter arboris TaxID=2072846 RepID=A0A2T2YPJ7_9BACT|nr:carboxymuconolactone decarboxylase family protein [Adhaeribacter arboris]PSR57442.1 carboxymuconolactone decarboxylase family protein [Adhaeribacter arboris]